jgi:hypothetical protein
MFARRFAHDECGQHMDSPLIVPQMSAWPSIESFW